MNIASTALQIIIGLIFLFTGVTKLSTPKQNLPNKGVTGFENISPNLIKILAFTEIIGAMALLIFSLPSFPKLPILIVLTAFALLMIAASYHHLHRKETKSLFTTLVLLFTCLITFLIRWHLI